MSNYLENALINEVLRATGYTAPTTVYVALFTSDPTDAGSGTECSGTSYARQSATFAAPSNGASSTSADINFPQAGGSWGTTSNFALDYRSILGSIVAGVFGYASPKK